MALKDVIWLFVKGIFRNRLSAVGATINLIVTPILLTVAILDMQGLIKSPSIRFFTYGILGPILILGLMLVAIGIFFGKKSLFGFGHLQQQWRHHGLRIAREMFLIVAILSVVNLVVMAVVFYAGYHFTESPDFCGLLCHKVMEPEYVSYLHSPHSRIRCPECHVGPGARWFVKSKVEGLKEVYHLLTNTYPRPIPTPLENLRPARAICEECHRPEFFYGDSLHIKEKFSPDEASTPYFTVMLMRVGGGEFRGMKPHGIHWHVAPENRITYRCKDRERREIVEVIVHRPEGDIVYRRKGKEVKGCTRVMDCLDCHNRPTHVFYPPEEAVDHLISIGEIPRDLPYVKKVAVQIITADYPSREEAKRAIEAKMRKWYEERYPDLVKEKPQLLEKAIAGAQRAYLDNVFPRMKVSWNTYTNFLGHEGCFRCHDDELATPDGKTLSMDCELCHYILAEEEKAPEILDQLYPRD